jgi:hypothetical protein
MSEADDSVYFPSLLFTIPSHLPYPLLPSRDTGREEGDVPSNARDRGRWDGMAAEIPN